MADIIFICNANMCRSPMAEGIMRKKVADSGLKRITVSSMGIHAQEGSCATDFAIAVCRERSIDIENHRSRPLLPSELKMSRLIFAMEPVQVDYIDLFFPQVADRLFMLASWPDRKGKKAAIADPVGKSIDAYRKTFLLLDKHIECVLPDLLQRYRGSAED